MAMTGGVANAGVRPPPLDSGLGRKDGWETAVFIPIHGVDGHCLGGLGPLSRRHSDSKAAPNCHSEPQARNLGHPATSTPRHKAAGPVLAGMDRFLTPLRCVRNDRRGLRTREPRPPPLDSGLRRKDGWETAVFIPIHGVDGHCPGGLGPLSRGHSDSKAAPNCHSKPQARNLGHPTTSTQRHKAAGPVLAGMDRFLTALRSVRNCHGLAKATYGG